jgi:hypothetical protein
VTYARFATLFFNSDCKVALEDEYCALFEEHKHHWFVEALMASMEYQSFYDMMLRAARGRK